MSNLEEREDRTARRDAPVVSNASPPRTLDEALVRLRAALDPNDILATLNAIGLDARDLAVGVGADERTVRRWLEGASPNRSHEAAIGELRVLVIYILQRRGLALELVPRWLRLPDSELGFASPLAALGDRPSQLGDVIAAVDAFIAPPPRSAPGKAAAEAPKAFAEHQEHAADDEHGRTDEIPAVSGR